MVKLSFHCLVHGNLSATAQGLVENAICDLLARGNPALSEKGVWDIFSIKLARLAVKSRPSDRLAMGAIGIHPLTTVPAFR